MFELARADKGNINYGKYEDKDGNAYILILNDVEIRSEPDASRDDFLTQQISNMKSKADNVVLINSARDKSKIEYNLSKKYLNGSSDSSED